MNIFKQAALIFCFTYIVSLPNAFATDYAFCDGDRQAYTNEKLSVRFGYKNRQRKAEAICQFKEISEAHVTPDLYLTMYRCKKERQAKFVLGAGGTGETMKYHPHDVSDEGWFDFPGASPDFEIYRSRCTL